jgi:hypothetical protein
MFSDTQDNVTPSPQDNGGDYLPGIGDVCRPKMGLTVRVIGPPAVKNGTQRLLCEILDPGPSEASQRGQLATFRADWLSPS